jgi:hypothetical protein
MKISNLTLQGEVVDSDKNGFYAGLIPSQTIHS